MRNKSLISASGGEVEPLFLDGLDEVEAILDELRISQGRGNLILCSISAPAYRERVIQLLGRRFATVVLLIDSGNQLISALKDLSLKDAEILVWVLPESLSPDLLEALNNFRELFYQKQVPSVLFVTPAAIDDIIRQAPDLWRYRGGFHELVERRSERVFQALETLATSLDLSYGSKEDLLRRKRINEYLLDKIQVKEERAKILNELSAIHILLGEYRKSIGFSEKALAISREIKDRAGEGRHLGNLGVAYSALGESWRALEYYDQALAISRENGDKKDEGTSLENLGMVYSDLGENQKAIEYYEQALKISRDIGNKMGEGSSLGSLGGAYYLSGEARKAIEYYTEALAIIRETGYRMVEGQILSNLGSAYSDLGEIQKAIEYYEKALEISQEIGDKGGEGTRLCNLGSAYYLLGDLQKATEYYERALAITREIGDRIGEATCLGSFALALDELGQRDRAIELTRDALKIFEQIESPNAEKACKQLVKLQSCVD